VGEGSQGDRLSQMIGFLVYDYPATGIARVHNIRITSRLRREARRGARGVGIVRGIDQGEGLSLGRDLLEVGPEVNAPIFSRREEAMLAKVERIVAATLAASDGSTTPDDPGPAGTTNVAWAATTLRSSTTPDGSGRRWTPLQGEGRGFETLSAHRDRLHRKTLVRTSSC
jgi:hypothetical protein